MSSVNPLDGASLAVQLIALEENQHLAQIESGKSEVRVQTVEHAYQRQQEIAAADRAREEAKSAAFWNDVAIVAKDVAVVASVAGAAFTGGSTLIIAASIAGGALAVGG